MFRVDRDKIPYLILENNKSANLRENKTCKQWGAYLCSKGTQICVTRGANLSGKGAQICVANGRKFV